MIDFLSGLRSKFLKWIIISRAYRWDHNVITHILCCQLWYNLYSWKRHRTQRSKIYGLDSYTRYNEPFTSQHVDFGKNYSSVWSVVGILTGCYTDKSCSTLFIIITYRFASSTTAAITYSCCIRIKRPLFNRSVNTISLFTGCPPVTAHVEQKIEIIFVLFFFRNRNSSDGLSVWFRIRFEIIFNGNKNWFKRVHIIKQYTQGLLINGHPLHSSSWVDS